MVILKEIFKLLSGILGFNDKKLFYMNFNKDWGYQICIKCGHNMFPKISFKSQLKPLSF